jgi:Fe-S-cluster containining protein
MRACTQCGKCCLKYEGGDWLGSASETDMLGWVIHGPEVLDYVGGLLQDLWISPVTGEKLQRCPWLRKLPRQEKYTCRIHAVRPEVCRDYPIDIDQMIDLDCEMLEAGDLDKPYTQLLIELNELRNASA